MKWSRYSKLFKSKRNGWMLFSSASRAFLLVKDEELPIIRGIMADPEGYDYSAVPMLYMQLLHWNSWWRMEKMMHSSIYSSSDSGRNRNRNDRRKVRYSFSCVSGVRVNLVGRSMSFMEPVLPDEVHPCGYRVLETLCFENAEDYRKKLEMLFRRHACADLPKNEPIRIHPGVKIGQGADQTFLIGDGVAFRIPADRWNAKIVKALSNGSSFAEIF